MATMREITFKVVQIDEIILDYKEMLLNVLKTPKNRQSAMAEEMETVLPIRAALRSAEGKCLLSEEAWKELNERVQDTQWTAILPEFKQYMDDIKNAPKVEVAPA